MRLANVFGLLPAEIRYNNNLSDFSKILFVEIYCYNFTGIFNISNHRLAVDLGKSKVTISRAISELVSNGLITANGWRENRNLTVKRFLNEMVIQDCNNKELLIKTKNTSISPALQEFYNGFNNDNN